ncbi:MAG: hypothetical protein ABSB42_08910 [Tepidisphaeraceae bacterium]|jgi:hypothetical protein
MSESEEPNWGDPHWQNNPSVLASLQFLRSLTPHFQPIERELTDAEWTAFRYLTEKGAVEGITRVEFTDNDGKKRIEHYHVRGNYIKALPNDSVILKSEPFLLDLAQARLTAIGEGWAAYLKREAEHPREARALVLTLCWKSPNLPGIATRTTPGNARRKEGKEAIASAQPEGHIEINTSQILSAWWGLGATAKPHDVTEIVKRLLASPLPAYVETSDLESDPAPGSDKKQLAIFFEGNPVKVLLLNLHECIHTAVAERSSHERPIHEFGPEFSFLLNQTITAQEPSAISIVPQKVHSEGGRPRVSADAAKLRRQCLKEWDQCPDKAQVFCNRWNATHPSLRITPKTIKKFQTWLADQ